MSFEGTTITEKQYDQRSAGKFKPEFKGHGMCCLNSKVYHIWQNLPDGTIKTKTSCKGAQKSRNNLGKEHFLAVRESHKPHRINNSGIIKDNLTMKTYLQTKVGLSDIYLKREVEDDGIHTKTLKI